MSDEIHLPTLTVRTPDSAFRLRCHMAAWAGEYGGQYKVRRGHYDDCPGLLVLSATGPDTAAKAVRASLYQPDVEAAFLLNAGDTTQRLLKARLTASAKGVIYRASLTKLAPGVVHLVALAQIPGLMPKLSDDHLWAELAGPRYTTPLLRRWVPWLIGPSRPCMPCSGMPGLAGRSE